MACNSYNANNLHEHILFNVDILTTLTFRM